jgi:hypothetical protein
MFPFLFAARRVAGLMFLSLLGSALQLVSASGHTHYGYFNVNGLNSLHVQLFVPSWVITGGTPPSALPLEKVLS